MLGSVRGTKKRVVYPAQPGGRKTQGIFTTPTFTQLYALMKLIARDNAYPVIWAKLVTRKDSDKGC